MPLRTVGAEEPSIQGDTVILGKRGPLLLQEHAHLQQHPSTETGIGPNNRHLFPFATVKNDHKLQQHFR